MPLRPTRAADRRGIGILRLVAVLSFVASSAGCMGADDNTQPPADGAPSDGSSADARDGAPHGEAGAGAVPVDGGSADGSHDSGGSQDARSEASLPTGQPFASFSSGPIDFGEVPCGGTKATLTFNVSNRGSGPLAVSATTTMAAVFSASPTTFVVAPGKSQMLTLAASVSASSTADATLVGSLNLFTNDPSNASSAVRLSVTPSGANFVLQPTAVQFPPTKVGQPATPQTFTIRNIGNADGTLLVGSPSDAQFSLTGTAAGGTVVSRSGGTWTGTVGFTPKGTANASTSVTLGVSGVTCAETMPSSITLAGQGSTGAISWSASSLDFGLANCGGAPPAQQTFTLTNAAAFDTLLTNVAITAGFTTSAVAGLKVPAGGSPVTVTVNAPAVPAVSTLAPIQGQLTIATDADTKAGGTSMALTVEPQGAVLAFDAPATFGSFAPQVLLVPPVSQTVSVKNSGNAVANVTLVALTNGGADGGAGDGGPDATVADAGLDATTDATIDSATNQVGAPSPFTVSNGLPFALAGGATQTDSVSFAPVAAGGVSGTLALTTSDPVCQPLPAALPLAGVGIGAGPSIAPATVTFPALCGGAAPAAQTVTVANNGTLNMTWTMSAVTGAGAARYKVAVAPPPGTLLPGAQAIITVTAPAIPSPAPQVDPSALAAAFTINTDVPFDPPHVVSLTETPIGDQLSFSVNALKFGQVPVGVSTVPLTFAIVSSASPGPGSTDANVSLKLTLSGDAGASPFALTAPTSLPSLSAGATSSAGSVVFSPSVPGPYAATISLVTTDTLCAPLPPPLPLVGTGTAGQVSVTPAIAAFGTDPKDPAGLVNCGASGPQKTIAVSNTGNQTFNLTAVSLGAGAMSPYTFTAPMLPASVAIGGSVSIAVTPNPIPSAVPNPDDTTAFADTLTITTDAALDMPHAIPLVMQARGAIIANTPLATTWSFGTIGFGSIGTFTGTIHNTGNAPASVALTGLAQPTIFGLQINPTTAAPNAVTPVVGQFTPPSSNGSWSDQATLGVTVAPQDAFCAPLPAAWATPTIVFSGATNSNAAVTASGSLSFPATDCGSAAPAAQSVVLTNNTNVGYLYTLRLNAGAHYTIANAGPGMIAANANATVLVAPQTVAPGQGVVPGAAPYADTLFVTVSTKPATTFNIPISWTLNGAALSLPQGAGTKTDTQGHSFYPADSMSAFTLPLANSGTATATVDFAVQPLMGSVVLAPRPVNVFPGLSTAAQLNSASSTACPATTSATVTFLYSGPVCQPFQVPSINVHSCAGTFPP